jgi:fumarate hydratase subunit alpha
MEANYDLGNDVVSAFQHAIHQEQSEIGKDVFNELILNAEIATTERVPMCQDIGMEVFFIN